MYILSDCETDDTSSANLLLLTQAHVLLRDTDFRPLVGLSQASVLYSSLAVAVRLFVGFWCHLPTCWRGYTLTVRRGCYDACGCRRRCRQLHWWLYELLVVYLCGGFFQRYIWHSSAGFIFKAGRAERPAHLATGKIVGEVQRWGFVTLNSEGGIK